jgi:p-hydroxybenzoate 3-monooxygenase
MCDFIVGCDGYHGISRKVIPKNLINIFERVYPFGWLGILSETPPVKEELIYANHGNGFALASMRNNNLSRYYIQTSLDDRVEGWDDKRFWEELKRRLPIEALNQLLQVPLLKNQ